MVNKKQQGFTLVELVIVIILLGLLAAAALPRFLNVTAQAQTAAVEGVAGGFSTGAALVKAQWIADGNSIGTADVEVVLDGGSVYVNTNGWASNTANTDTSSNGQTAAECLQVWEFVMQNPPQATTATTYTNSDKYAVAVQQGTPDICVYGLIVNEELDTQGRQFTYNLGTGQTVVTVP